MPGAFTYSGDPSSSSLDAVRFGIPDTDDTQPLLTDAEIAYCLAAESDVVDLAVARALETIATNEVLVLKVIDLLDVKVDGAKVADSLLKRASLLRDRAGDDEGEFDIAEMVVDDFTYRERLEKDYLRGAS